MKLTLTLILIVSVFSQLSAQSVTAEYYTGYETVNTSQFPLQEGFLTESGSSYQFGTDKRVTISSPVGLAVSDDLSMIGCLESINGLEANIYNYKGKELLTTELEFVSPTDETIGLTLLDNGDFIVRDNVANFSFFDAKGDRAYTYSNSSQASRGEQTSEIAVSEDGVIKVAYNPVIRYQNSLGSRISIVTGDGEADQIFISQNRVILSLAVSRKDHTVSVVTEGGNGSRKIHWFDRFGNLLYEMESELDVAGFNVTKDGKFITVFSGNRVQVYQRDSAERLGSASSRSTILQAAYFPESNLIVALGGQEVNQQISNPEITAVDLQRRQIERVQLSESIMFRQRSHISIENVQSNTYRIIGINRPIKVTAQF
ncbi:hypothetical protein [Rhodohalobacter sp. 8-1]|uniref:hypothetical protein n=1 Tax=Rhodohalobacter sp. 8-1 TaxID=3131972 RepID=UPI0030ED2238